MQRQTLLLFIGTIVVFFLLITAALITILVMPPEVVEDDIELNKYFKERKEKVLNSIKNVKFVNVQDYIKDPENPVPDINRVLAGNNHVIFPKSFHGVLNGKISVPNNTIIQFEEGTELRGSYPSLPSPGEYCLFSLYGVRNVTLIGNNAIINTANAKTPPEGFPTICLHGAKDVFIMDLSLAQPAGYGVEVSRYTHQTAFNYPSEKVDLYNVQVAGARKGGILVESVDTLKAYKVVVEKSAGIAPENGVTIVAAEKDSLIDVQIQDLVTAQNEGVGLEIMPGVSMDSKFSMIVKGYTSNMDGEFAPIYLRNSPADGKITLKNLELTHREGLSALIRTWDTRKCQIDVFKMKINEEKDFAYVVTDRKGDPFESNLENLNIRA